MKPAELNRLKTTVIAASQASGKVLMKYYEKKFSVREKKNAGLVTNADVESEELAIKILLKKYPSFGILAEESSPVRSKSGERFIMDPLDGTTNFVHGFPMFCVSIAAEVAGKIEVGVIFHPVLKDLYVAVRGQGAYLNGKKLRVSKTKKLKDSLLTTGFTAQKDDWLKTEMKAFERSSSIARAVRRPGSAALDLAYTARGVFDGFWERRLSPWDVAAGALIVQEAGGKVTDFHGNPFDIEAKEILVSNGVLHQNLLDMLFDSPSS